MEEVVWFTCQMTITELNNQSQIKRTGNSYMNKEQSQFPKIIWPSNLSIISHAAMYIVISQLVIYLDNARGMAYILIPVIIVSNLLKESNITFKHHFKTALGLYALGLAWVFVGLFTLAQIISIEEGDAMISSGIIYDITSKMVSK